ncbi:MAG TPA: nuclear transport factor 2 family protein [Candidatus Dormibacteraeota bacterium]|nr:nuclear transport factor 2 family protein [Candidatus Dormibacteraeota bacterium]
MEFRLPRGQGLSPRRNSLRQTDNPTQVSNADARFEAEEIIVDGNRATVLWVYHKVRNRQLWHLRGVDVFAVRDGKVDAKLAYVKG